MQRELVRVHGHRVRATVRAPLRVPRGHPLRTCDPHDDLPVQQAVVGFLAVEHLPHCTPTAATGSSGSLFRWSGEVCSRAQQARVGQAGKQAFTASKHLGCLMQPLNRPDAIPTTPTMHAATAAAQPRYWPTGAAASRGGSQQGKRPAVAAAVAAASGGGGRAGDRRQARTHDAKGVDV